MEKALGVFQNGLFSRPLPETWGVFSWLRSLVRFIEVKSMEMWGPPQGLQPQEFLTVTQVHASLRTTCQSYDLDVPASFRCSRGSVSGKLMWLWFSVVTCLSRFWRAVCPATSIPWWVQEKSLVLKFVPFCSCCKDGSDDFQVLYMMELKLEALRSL